MRVVVVGGSGFLGGELVRVLAAGGHTVVATYLSRPGDFAGVEWVRVDVRDREADYGLLPDVVVNAAYRQADWETTALGGANVALAAARADARLVHVSSDAVFSGKAVTYTEDSVPDPVTPYGAAKAAAEVAVQAIVPEAAVVRTSLIVGDGGSSHESFVRALADGRQDGALFTDVVRCPVHVADLAAALAELVVAPRPGMHHVAGADAVSRYELGRLIAERDGLDPAALPSTARGEGPLDIRLDCAATQRHLRTRLRGAREFLSGA
ncbi:sugar nucleotide-binding protein [Nonomuraea sp. NPDC050556]|uniref:sugar nucleotide-binding protein n=1 Tax=Nonomuraea sp. NPDC050556 TaxID=3364369 RepID=UPI00378C9485